MDPRAIRRRQRDLGAERARGASLLELIAALGITTVVAGLSGGALARLARATAVQAARVRVMSALLEGRRLAYAAEATVEVSARADDSSVVIHTPDARTISVALPAGTVITHAPANGRVRFYASGLADNATFAVGSPDRAASEEQVIVNQRGLVR